jgi:hypothetical protein
LAILPAVDDVPDQNISEFAFMVNYLKANLNDTDIVAAGSNAYSFWDDVSPKQRERREGDVPPY